MPAMLTKSFQCDTCKRKFVWKPELAGKRLRCKCGQAVSVPADGVISPPRAIPPRAIPPRAAMPAPPVPLPQAVAAPTLQTTEDEPQPIINPQILLVMVIASIVVGVLSIWANWYVAAEWGKAYRGSAPGSSNPLYPGDPKWIQGLYIHSLATIGLAVGLIGAGAMLLVQPVLGVKLHRWYAVLKIFFLLTEILLCVYYFMSVSDSGPSQIHFDVSAGTTGLLESVGLQSIYPIAIFVLLRAGKRGKACPVAIDEQQSLHA